MSDDDDSDIDSSDYENKVAVDAALLDGIEQVKNMKAQCLGIFRRRMSKRDIVELFNEHYEAITGRNVILRYDRQNVRELSIDIMNLDSRDTYARDEIIDLIGGSFPYLMLNWTDGEAAKYIFVSRAKYQSEVLGVESPVPEDNVHSTNDYAKYHAIHGSGTIRPYKEWFTHYRRTLWCNLQPRYLRWCIALAPLKLTLYEVLWILDWIPSVITPHLDTEHCPYDFNRLRKLRLIESVAKAWRRMV